jgi:Ca-activated chloride channel family protein
LIGYENRKLAAADFDNDRKDAGEIGAGHRVTALYEIVPVGKEGTIPGNIELRYGAANDAKPDRTNQAPTASDNPSAHADEWMLLKVRSKQPEASESTKQEFLLKDGDAQLLGREQADLEWAVCVAEFGLLLRRSPLASAADWDRVLSRAAECILDDPYRRECYTIMQQSKPLSQMSK